MYVKAKKNHLLRKVENFKNVFSFLNNPKLKKQQSILKGGFALIPVYPEHFALGHFALVTCK